MSRCTPRSLWWYGRKKNMKLLTARSVDYLESCHDYLEETLLLSFKNAFFFAAVSTTSWVPSGSVTLKRRRTSPLPVSQNLATHTKKIYRCINSVALQVRGEISVLILGWAAPLQFRCGLTPERRIKKAQFPLAHMTRPLILTLWIWLTMISTKLQMFPETPRLFGILLDYHFCCCLIWFYYLHVETWNIYEC